MVRIPSVEVDLSITSGANVGTGFNCPWPTVPAVASGNSPISSVDRVLEH